MSDLSMPFVRSGTIIVEASLERVFPLLCPKREEEWIPGWQCEVIASKSGCNEPGAIFRTTRPYATELIWFTVRYSRTEHVVEFVNHSPNLFVFHFLIDIAEPEPGRLVLTFTQRFTPVSGAGAALIDTYRGEDFAGRLKVLEELLRKAIARTRAPGQPVGGG